MKYQWEADDVRVGRRVRTKSKCHICMMGYLSGTPKPEGNRVLISMDDGAVMKIGSDLDLMQHLNKHQYTPEPNEK